MGACASGKTSRMKARGEPSDSLDGRETSAGLLTASTSDARLASGLESTGDDSADDGGEGGKVEEG